MANSLRIWGLNNPPNLNRKELGCMLNYKRGLNVIDYVDTCYHTQTYFKEYENFILPMNEMELWDRTNIPPCVPPSYSKQPRRPRKARRKEASECNKKANVVTKVQDSLSTKIRRAKPARFVHKGKWKRKATIAAGSSNASPTDSAALSSISAHPASVSASLATGSAPPASTEASTGNSFFIEETTYGCGSIRLEQGMMMVLHTCLCSISWFGYFVIRRQFTFISWLPFISWFD
ncbi:unnamed protein product [Prunus armeniaca]|uniref:Uncharacterized protein n=1 Tax=Prunus armeniaca TaxID=36596 RepID=A0A6J5U2N0_PRUAR|nr:unnamed protein product [Prunus armeniaca]